MNKEKFIKFYNNFHNTMWENEDKEQHFWGLMGMVMPFIYTPIVVIKGLVLCVCCLVPKWNTCEIVDPMFDSMMRTLILFPIILYALFALIAIILEVRR